MKYLKVWFALKIGYLKVKFSKNTEVKKCRFFLETFRQQCDLYIKLCMITFNLFFFTPTNLLLGNMRKVFSKSINLNINQQTLIWFPATIGNRNKERANKNYWRKLLKLQVNFNHKLLNTLVRTYLWFQYTWCRARNNNQILNTSTKLFTPIVLNKINVF